MEFRKCKRSPIVLITGIFAFTIWFFLLRNTEPTYAGKTLSEWVVTRATAQSYSERTQAKEAIKAIGTNALPYLVKWTAFDPGRLRRKIWEHELAIPDWVWNLPVIGKVLDGGQDRAWLSQYAFETLGDDAATAIPRLNDIALAPGNPEANQRALMSLMYVGPKATPVLTNLLAKTNLAGDPMLPAVLKGWGPNAAPLIPVLLQNLASSNNNVVISSIRTLGALRINPHRTIPALVTTTSHPLDSIRFAAVTALSNFGPEASNSVPALNKLLSDPNEHVRTNAAATINQITRNGRE